MDVTSVFAGPIRGLSARQRLQDTALNVCSSRQFIEPEDMDSVIKIHNSAPQKVPLVPEVSIERGHLTQDKAKSPDTKKNKRAAAAARANGLLTKSINGTGMTFAWAVHVVEQLPTDGPAEPAGPLQPGCAITISNTLGNIISYGCNDASVVWVLGYDGHNAPAWLAAEEGYPHPDSDNLTGYGLTIRNPNRPSWVKMETIDQYRAPSKRRVTSARG